MVKGLKTYREKQCKHEEQATHLWNQLPVVIQEIDTLFTFKIRLKTIIFARAYRAGSRDPESSLSYVASHDAP